MSTFKRKQRFDLVKRKADGKIIKWEQKRLSELGILPDTANDYDIAVLQDAPVGNVKWRRKP